MAMTDSEFWEYVKEYRNGPYGWWVNCPHCAGTWTPDKAEGAQGCPHCGRGSMGAVPEGLLGEKGRPLVGDDGAPLKGG